MSFNFSNVGFFFFYLSSRPPANMRLGSFTSWSCNEVCFANLTLLFVLFCFVAVFVAVVVVCYSPLTIGPKLRIIFRGIFS